MEPETKKLGLIGALIVTIGIGGTIAMTRLNDKGEETPVDIRTALEAKIGPQSEFRANQVAKEVDVLKKPKKVIEEAVAVSEDVSEEVLLGAEEEETKSPEQIVDEALVMLLRRIDGDEPTQEEWIDVEGWMDQLRMSGDSPVAAQLDRVLEVTDASLEIYAAELAELLETNDL